MTLLPPPNRWGLRVRPVAVRRPAVGWGGHHADHRQPALRRKRTTSAAIRTRNMTLTVLVELRVMLASTTLVCVASDSV